MTKPNELLPVDALGEAIHLRLLSRGIELKKNDCLILADALINTDGYTRPEPRIGVDLDKFMKLMPKPIESIGDDFPAGWFWEMDDVLDAIAKFGHSPLRLPERKEFDESSIYGRIENVNKHGWNACLDAVKKLNASHASLPTYDDIKKIVFKACGNDILDVKQHLIAQSILEFLKGEIK